LRKANGIGDALAVKGYGEGVRWPTHKGERLGQEGWFSLAATGGLIVLVVVFGGSF
jgi:hypothetical protein